MSFICSVLMPSRNRTKSLQEAIDAFLDTANEPDRVEIIVRLHDDDEDSLAWAKTRPKRIRVIVGDSGDGYASCSEWVNCMAAVSKGDWIWPAADDCRVHTRGWDRILAELTSQPRRDFLLLRSSFEGSQLCVMTRGFYWALGHFGMTEHGDTYTGWLARCAGIERTVDVDFRHLNLPTIGQRDRQKTWDELRGDEASANFDMDKLKLGAVMGKPIEGNWNLKMEAQYLT